jgi:hypothetical protein
MPCSLTDRHFRGTYCLCHGSICRWWWKKWAPLIRLNLSTRLDGMTSHKTVVFIVTIVVTWNLTVFVVRTICFDTENIFRTILRYYFFNCAFASCEVETEFDTLLKRFSTLCHSAGLHATSYRFLTADVWVRSRASKDRVVVKAGFLLVFPFRLSVFFINAPYAPSL